MLYDEKNPLPQALQIEFLPTIVSVDPDGRVLNIYQKFDESSDEAILAGIEGIVREMLERFAARAPAPLPGVEYCLEGCRLGAGPGLAAGAPLYEDPRPRQRQRRQLRPRRGRRHRVLVDAGLSGSELERRIAAVGADVRDLAGILITHEHADHVRGAGILARRHGIPVYLTPGTHEAERRHLGEMPTVRHIKPGHELRTRRPRASGRSRRRTRARAAGDTSSGKAWRIRWPTCSSTRG